MFPGVILLNCPRHKIQLKPSNTHLLCEIGCQYSIVKQIPRFVPQLYTEAFGFQWRTFSKTQLDSYSGVSITRNRLIEATGYNLAFDLKGKHILEVGCGAGRFTEILLDLGSVVYSIDHSNAVEVNASNFPISNNHYIVQGDIGSIPYPTQAFDVVFCLGVIQHTPDPEKTIRNLIDQVKPGGWLVIDHYAHSLSWYLRTAPVFRLILKRMNPQLSFKVVGKIHRLAQPVYGFSRNRYYRKLLHMIFPIVYFENEIPSLPERLKFEWGLLDTYDSLTDWNKHRRSEASIRKSLSKSGLIDIECFHNGNAIVARARRVD